MSPPAPSIWVTERHQLGFVLGRLSIVTWIKTQPGIMLCISICLQHNQDMTFKKEKECGFTPSPPKVVMSPIPESV